jgi:hypothetical protein
MIDLWVTDCQSISSEQYASCCRQAFLDVYATLREELLNDKMLEGQPQEAKDWLKEVSRLSSVALPLPSTCDDYDDTRAAAGQLATCLQTSTASLQLL